MYKLKDLGIASDYLGMEIDQNNGITAITQKRDFQKLSMKFKMQDCKAAPTSMEEGLKLRKAPEGYDCNPGDRHLCQELEGF